MVKEEFASAEEGTKQTSLGGEAEREKERASSQDEPKTFKRFMKRA